jgi:hypothetical protein
MALNLVSGMGLVDPRVDGYKTFAGAAMGTFLKIRTDMNLAIWKMRLKLADPTALIEREMAIRERIFELRKIQAEMNEASADKRAQIIKDLTADRTKRYKIDRESITRLSIAGHKTLNESLKARIKFSSTMLPSEAKESIDERAKEDFLGPSSAVGEFTTAYVFYYDKGEPSSEELKKLQDMLRVKFRDGWFTATNAAQKKAGQSESDMLSPKNKLEKTYQYAHAAPRAVIQGLAKIANKKLKAARDTGDTKAARRAALELKALGEIELSVLQGVNEARYGKGSNKDIMAEWDKRHENKSETEKRALGIISGAMPGYSEIALQSDEDIIETAERLTDTSEMGDLIKSDIDALRDRLGLVRDKTEQAYIEQERLLGLDGINMAMYPFSRRESDIGHTMRAIRQRSESQPGLEETVGISQESFPPGEGGNLSLFLKARIGQYVDRIDAGGGDRAMSDFSGMSSTMDQVAQAMDLYKGSLTPADVEFIRPVNMIGGSTTSLSELVDSYRKNAPNMDPEVRDRFAAATLDQIKAGDAPIAAERMSMQRYGTETQKSDAAYNEAFYPLKTNISVVLGPKIDSMIRARDSDDMPAFRSALNDIYKVVENPDLDDLYGSSGEYIRMALQDTGVSSGQIGDMNAALNASAHIQDQYNAMMEQRVREDEDAQSLYPEVASVGP